MSPKRNQNQVRKASLTSLRAEIGLFFKDLRIDAEVSEESMAEYLGDVSVDKLRLYESGQKPIPLCYIYAMANRLNIPADLVQKVLNGEI